MSTIRWLLQTDSGVVGLILRITLAVVFFPHGAQKVLGWFGGHGFKGTMKYFTDSGIPTVFALLAMAAEFLGPVGLAVGLLTRVAALGIACVMLVAIVRVHWPNGFFMNWFGNQKGERIRIPPARARHGDKFNYRWSRRLVTGRCSGGPTLDLPEIAIMKRSMAE